jgi:hypothetical protein
MLLFFITSSQLDAVVHVHWNALLSLTYVRSGIRNVNEAFRTRMINAATVLDAYSPWKLLYTFFNRVQIEKELMDRKREQYQKTLQAEASSAAQEVTGLHTKIRNIEQLIRNDETNRAGFEEKTQELIQSQQNAIQNLERFFRNRIEEIHTSIDKNQEILAHDFQTLQKEHRAFTVELDSVKKKIVTTEHRIAQFNCDIQATNGILLKVDRMITQATRALIYKQISSSSHILPKSMINFEVNTEKRKLIQQ